ncbi:MAG: hypothetical protein GEV07_07865 [Streptosporangiales bacterium]|nr:hypothetical protein [Streptosporangiales bacterium]
MNIADLATEGRLASVDNQLARLATDLRQLRGEYAAELDTLHKIDQLLDQRLILSSQPTGQYCD